MMTRRVAFVTYAEAPGMTADDRLAADALSLRGVAVVAAPWDDLQVSWTSFDAVVIRSCWNYIHQTPQFLAWIAQIEAAGVPLWNGADVVRWNYEKTYLRELEAHGVAVVPSVWAMRGDRVSIDDIASARGWPRVVAKPTVSMTAFQTWVTSLPTTAVEQCRFDDLLEQRGMVLQEYLPEIEDAGEWSFVFLDGEYSHAVIKRACAGEFRVQSDFGGTWTRQHPTDALVKTVTAIVAAAQLDLLYARVDGVIHGDRFLLMELEAIEPQLFFGAAPESPDRFAAAILRRLGAPLSV